MLSYLFLKKSKNFLISMLCMPLLVFFPGVTPVRAELVDRILAIVNDDIILLSEFEEAVDAYRQIIQESGQTEGWQPLSDAQKSQLLNQMIDEKLVDQEAKRLGITIQEDEVDRAIEHIRRVNKVSVEEMERMFALKGMTMEKYRAQIKEQLLQRRIVNREVKSKVVITEEDVQRYYQDRRKEYGGQTKYHLRHIFMQVPSPDEREHVRSQMQQLHERLRNGESFASLAEVYSQSSSAGEGGDLGLFESRLLAKEIRDAVEHTGPGEFTEPVETDQGFQLFYVEEIVQTGGKSLDDAREEIYQTLSAQMTERKFEDWFKELRQRAHIQILQ